MKKQAINRLLIAYHFTPRSASASGAHFPVDLFRFLWYCPVLDRRQAHEAAYQITKKKTQIQHGRGRRAFSRRGRVR